MTERLSQGLQNALIRAFRTALADSKIMIYSGSAPTTANAAVTGVHLVTISKSAATPSTRSLPNQWTARIPKTGSTGTNVIPLAIRFDPAGVTGATTSISYTSGADPTTKNLDSSLTGLLREINDAGLGMYTATRQGSTGQTGWFNIKCDVPGDEINVRGSTLVTGAREVFAESRGNWIYFGDAATGAISKVSETWSGTVGTSGVAGYFRIVGPDDDGTASYTQVRIQGAISTSGAEMNLSNTSLVAGTTLTIDTASVEMPAE